MSHERKRNTNLAQSRRRAIDDEDEIDNSESGPAIIDDSASENEEDDVLQLSGSDDDEAEDEDDVLPAPRHPKTEADEGGKAIDKPREPSRAGPLPSTSNNYDRLQDDMQHSADFVVLGTSNSSIGKRVTDTSVMLNGFKDITTTVEGDGDERDAQQAIQFDELDDSVSFEPRARAAETTTHGEDRPRSSPSSVRGRGGPRGRRETYWQRRNRDKEEYKKKLEDPTFTPYVGEFFMHDSRGKRQFDSLNHQPGNGGGPRGRGRGRGGRGGSIHAREEQVRNHVQEEPVWAHDGFEEFFEAPQKIQPPQAPSKPSQTKSKNKPSSVGRQTPQQNGPNIPTEQPQQPQQLSKPSEPQASPAPKPPRQNVEELTSSVFTINISLPNNGTNPIVKQVKLTSYVGRVPYQKPLRGDRPVRISSIPGAGNREIYPSKERSWLPYFLKNAAAAHAAQTSEGVRSRGGSVASASGAPAKANTNTGTATPGKIPASAVYAQSFTPQSQLEDEEDKPTKIKVNLPVVAMRSSASPAVSDSSSLHVHHPRPTKHINIADIDDSSARLKALLNPQTSSSPSHSHERTSSAQLPETAVHAAPFQPSQFVPQQQQPQQTQAPPFNPAIPYFYPPFNPMQPGYSSATPPYFPPQQPQPQPTRYETNGMVYYYTDPSLYYQPFQPPLTTTQQSTHSSSSEAQEPAEQSDPSSSNAQPYYYYHPSQMGPISDAQRAASMGIFYPPYSGS